LDHQLALTTGLSNHINSLETQLGTNIFQRGQSERKALDLADSLSEIQSNLSVARLAWKEEETKARLWANQLTNKTLELQSKEALLGLAKSNALESASTLSNLVSELLLTKTSLADAQTQVTSLSGSVRRLESRFQSAIGSLLGTYMLLTPTIVATNEVPEIKVKNDEPNYEGFAFHSVDRVFDLRRWTNADPEHPEILTEAGSLIAHYQMERAVYKDAITIPFKTSGADVFPYAMAPFNDKSQVTFYFPTNSTLR